MAKVQTSTENQKQFHGKILCGKGAKFSQVTTHNLSKRGSKNICLLQSDHKRNSFKRPPSWDSSFKIQMKSARSLAAGFPKSRDFPSCNRWVVKIPMLLKRCGSLKIKICTKSLSLTYPFYCAGTDFGSQMWKRQEVFNKWIIRRHEHFQQTLAVSCVLNILYVYAYHQYFYLDVSIFVQPTKTVVEKKHK